MPQGQQPTREQFEAAAQRVMQSAPPGLTREQFFAKVDEEIRRSGGDIGGGLPTLQPKVEEPSTMGFVSNLAKDAFNTGSGLINAGNEALHNPLGTAMAIPHGIWNRVKQYASDIHPQDALTQLKEGRPGAALGSLLPVGEAYQRPVSMAADAYAGSQLAKIGKLASATNRLPPSGGKFAKVVEGEVVDPTLKHGAQEGEIVDGAHLPQRPPALGPGQYEMGPSSSPVLDAQGREIAPAQNMPMARPSGPWDMNVKTGSSAPMSEDAIYDALMENMGGNRGRTSGNPRAPRPPEAPGGEPPSSSHTGAVDREPGGNIPMGGERDTHHPASKRGGYVDQSPMPADVEKGLMESGPISNFPPEGGQGNWHAYADDAERAAADPVEKAQAHNLHRETAELDNRYDYLSDPNNMNSGFSSAGGALAKMLWDMLKEDTMGYMAKRSPDTVGRMAGMGMSALKKAPAGAAIARLNRDDEDE